MDVLSLQLNNMQSAQRQKRLADGLIQACRTGGDLLQCFGAAAVIEPQFQSQQHHHQQQHQLVQLLADPGGPVVDQYERNLLHLVATHSL